MDGASAKISDMKCEMTDKQKKELEKNKMYIIELQRDIADYKSKLASLSEIVDGKSKQNDKLKEELRYCFLIRFLFTWKIFALSFSFIFESSKNEKLLSKFRKTAEDNSALCIELKLNLENCEQKLKLYENINKQEVN